MILQSKVMSPTPLQPDNNALIALGVAVIGTEAEAIRALIPRIDNRFAKACRYILSCEGRIVIIGMGKSGHIGKKMAATFASTGTPAFFVHPGEAAHGDLGMLTDRDVVLALSNSGETEEILAILPVIKRLAIPLIILTGSPSSHMARFADVVIDVGVEKEACPLGLAPTASTTAALVMGDALAVALLDARGFSAEDFALAHPKGRLGRRLLLRLADIMHTGEAMPRVRTGAATGEALMEMTRAQLGTAVVVDPDDGVLGIFTDGDLRRALDQEIDIRSAPIDELMTRDCITVPPDLLAVEGLALMQSEKINALVVVDDGKHLAGVLNMHNFLRAGVL
uniref:Arabinose 5-phosphate isomerase n=1 Tax=Candidatus Kentrum eta TaxID=2126337 RepID=A0A450V782_9GAMM|nr:MAG: arabinose-5-phosphate isomerase [Candidatus Kentron sp. H]VFJ94013.1 MAG: arabinose-5-phosphate isomerase [Candidatus Kentron sp. H]VFK00682.1 MAG: arabinose-5-phosphate isomerase [Candidatus Kentron sp. H]